MKRIAGETLLELVVVLALMGALLTAVLPGLPGRTNRSRVDGAASIVAGALWQARTRARSLGREVTVTFSRTGSSFVITDGKEGRQGAMTGRTVRGPERLPDGVVYGRPSGADPIEFAADCLLFRPEGSVRGISGSLYLQSGSSFARLVVLATGEILIGQ